MDELTRRIRNANPYCNGRLPDSGEQLLKDLKTGSQAQVVEKAEPRPPRRPRYALFSGAAMVLAVLIIGLATLVGRPHTAVAVTPHPLPVRPTSASSEELLKELRSAPPTSGGASSPGYTVEGWYYQYDSEASEDQYIQPQRIESEIHPDGSGITRIFAGTPVDASGRPLVPLPDGASEPGTLLEEMPAGPGDLLTSFPTAPPEDAKQMRLYLDAYLASAGVDPPEGYRAGDYAFALVTLMQTWTLSEASQRAVIEVLLTSGGLKIAGSTVDRAGRKGVLLDLAPGSIFAGDSRDQLVIDTKNWRILASETISIDGFPEFNIAPGDVTSYTLWR